MENKQTPGLDTLKVGIIGLGYVGLPIAIEVAKKYPTIGFDIKQSRIAELRAYNDSTQEIETSELKSSLAVFSSDASDLSSCNFYVVTVPTPIDKYKKPDLRPLQSASKMLSSVLKKGDIVVYESTVFPGCTEEYCVPLLEEGSSLKFNEDFYCGYSPERINPGDKVHRLTTIKKVTSGSTKEIAELVDSFYRSFVEAGTHLASSIKVAEAAKVIENAQRDINIAFVNELSLIFSKMNIDTNEVLEAAGTKWNFLPFKPGLVGGHCIGVDPYYLTYKAESLGYHPDVILAGRRINDNMGVDVANRLVKKLAEKGQKTAGSKVLVLGITFKENCPDIRNSRVIDIIRELDLYGLQVSVLDPLASEREVSAEYGLNLVKGFSEDYDAFVLAVPHLEFKEIEWSSIKTAGKTIFDVKAAICKELSDLRL